MTLLWNFKIAKPDKTLTKAKPWEIVKYVRFLRAYNEAMYAYNLKPVYVCYTMHSFTIAMTKGLTCVFQC